MSLPTPAEGARCEDIGRRRCRQEEIQAARGGDIGTRGYKQKGDVNLTLTLTLTLALTLTCTWGVGTDEGEPEV